MVIIILFHKNNKNNIIMEGENYGPKYKYKINK